MIYNRLYLLSLQMNNFKYFLFLDEGRVKSLQTVPGRFIKHTAF